MQVLTIGLQKGGTGKTTTAAALAQAAAAKGQRVLAIDLDPQANLTYSLAATSDSGGSYALLTGDNAAIQTTAQHIDVLAATWDLSTITSYKGSARRLQAALEPLKRNYDIIIIDTPPNAGELQYNALQASTGLIIPLQADIYNMQALEQIADAAKQIQASNAALKIKGFIFTQYDSRSLIVHKMTDILTEQAAAIGVKCLGTVRNGVAIKEAAALQQSIFDYAPRSNPALDYMAIYERL